MKIFHIKHKLGENIITMILNANANIYSLELYKINITN